MVPANSTCKPKFKITEGKILAELLLLKPNLILAIENRMAKNFLQVSSNVINNNKNSKYKITIRDNGSTFSRLKTTKRG